jgi:hypothetical protein
MMTSLVTLGLSDFQVESGLQTKNRAVVTTALHSSLLVVLAAILTAWIPEVLVPGGRGKGCTGRYLRWLVYIADWL